MLLMSKLKRVSLRFISRPDGLLGCGERASRMPTMRRFGRVATKKIMDMQDSVDRPYHHGDLRRVLIETVASMLREDKGWQFRYEK